MQRPLGALSLPLLMLLLPAHAPLSPLSPTPLSHEGTCDFRLSESTRYSAWGPELSHLGVSTNTSININGEHLGSGKDVTLEAFLAQDAATVREMVRASVLPVVLGGARTTNLLVIDIEAPARPDGLYALNETALRRVVTALRLRIAVLRQLMPHCRLSFYGAPTRLHIAQAVAGYRRASRIGLFDELDYTTPSLYLSPGQDPTATTHSVLAAAAQIRRSDGQPLPLAPFISCKTHALTGTCLRASDRHCGGQGCTRATPRRRATTARSAARRRRRSWLCWARRGTAPSLSSRGSTATTTRPTCAAPTRTS